MILLAIQQQKRKKVAIQLMVKKNAKNKTKIASFFSPFP